MQDKVTEVPLREIQTRVKGGRGMTVMYEKVMPDDEITGESEKMRTGCHETRTKWVDYQRRFSERVPPDLLSKLEGHV